MRCQGNGRAALLPFTPNIYPELQVKAEFSGVNEGYLGHLRMIESRGPAHRVFRAAGGDRRGNRRVLKDRYLPGTAFVS